MIYQLQKVIQISLAHDMSCGGILCIHNTRTHITNSASNHHHSIHSNLVLMPPVIYSAPSSYICKYLTPTPTPSPSYLPGVLLPQCWIRCNQSQMITDLPQYAQHRQHEAVRALEAPHPSLLASIRPVVPTVTVLTITAVVVGPQHTTCGGWDEPMQIQQQQGFRVSTWGLRLRVCLGLQACECVLVGGGGAGGETPAAGEQNQQTESREGVYPYVASRSQKW